MKLTTDTDTMVLIRQAAEPIMQLGCWLSSVQEIKNLTLLQQELHAQLSQFKQRLLTIPKVQTQQAHYLLCTWLDEVILQTSWGIQHWGSHSLLSHYYQDSWGGEKFFTILAEAQANPIPYSGLLVLAYDCLCLGFQGKYRLEPNGKEQLHILKQKLADTLKWVNVEPVNLFDWSPNPHPTPANRLKLRRYLLIVLLVCAGLFALAKFDLWMQEKQVLHLFNTTIDDKGN